MPKTETQERVHFTAPPSLIAQIKRSAASESGRRGQNVPVSVWMREAIEYYMEALKQ